MSSTAVITPIKEGWMKKRGARMHRWSTRYFALVGASLTYKLKQESTSLRGTFDLVPGCILTEVEEDVKGAKKGKKLFSFWIVWPQAEDDKKTQKVDHDSDEEDAKDDVPKGKDLKQIVKSEVSTNRDKHRRAEEQLEKHHAQDSHLSMGMKVAAVAVGGVVVGALTAGIGLVPYITVVGITAVASGGAVAYQYRRPSDSRLILGADTVQEALAWKAALEEQILKLEAARKPMLPESVDPVVISNILGTSTGGGGGWVKVGQVENVRVMQQITASPPASLWAGLGLVGEGSVRSTGATKICRKAQIVLHCSPGDAFLSLMDTRDPYWPNAKTGGSLKAVQAVDDHVDTLEVCVPTAACFSWLRKESVGTVCGVLSRFWSLDDDGCYLITLSPHSAPAPPGATTTPSSNTCPLELDAVLTVSPRHDHEVFDDDLVEAMVTCTIQIDTTDKFWQRLHPAAIDTFLNDFVLQVLEMQERISMARFSLDSSCWLAAPAVPSKGATGVAGSRQLKHASSLGASSVSSLSGSTAARSTGGGVVTTQPGGAPSKKDAPAASSSAYLSRGSSLSGPPLKDALRADGQGE
jgi:hypothetical protein